MISGKLEIENDFDEDKDFEIDISLYDFTEDNEIENIDDTISIDENDKDKIEFEIKVDEDLEEDNKHFIYAKAADEDNESICNEKYLEIEIERERHNVIIDSFELPEKALCGDWIDSKVSVKNIGKRDEDVYLKIENKELNISAKSDEFELKKFDADNKDKHKATKDFSIKIPENINVKNISGNYKIKATAVYGSRETVSEKNIAVECRKKEAATSTLEKIKINGSKYLKLSGKKTGGFLDSINLFLIIGIIIVIIVIIIAIILKRR